ncbi:Membrane protein involved in the export of O-antigen and teichoic acid [Agromyces sp. CF514]|uniref:hypothetical protein n=1 Tax=Agromyces sp. CF514 TaxID=1881031 RepID=UPI0008DF3A9F|nr:hypothetical protein [Agromyces sp. CF514]SFR84141.1 Membrane protein involved in the export of O-antigen and teichoic acid [Agromyces sp. CF514]
MQALASFTIQVLVARTLGLDGLGAFAVVYGTMQIVSAVTGGFVGDAYAVLDRHTPRVRSALEQFGVLIPFLLGATTAGAFALTGLVDGPETIALALATFLFAVEEVVRRMLMASLKFWRVVTVDASAFAVSIAVVVGVWLWSTPSLVGFIAAVAAGQLVGAAVGLALLPASERGLVGIMRGGHGVVFRYGFWRAAQQVLRPAMLTVIRVVVVMTASLAAVGMIEAARTYVAPATLMVSGLGSFLFVHFAHDREASLAGKLRSADRAVLALVGLVVVVGGVMLALAPWLGPLLFGAPLDLIAVAGWIAFSTAIAAVAPYGSLASVAGAQGRLFAVRAADTLLAVVLAVGLLVAGGEPAYVPAVIAIAPVLGGLVVRRFLLVPAIRKAADSPPIAAGQATSDAPSPAS